MKLEQYESTYPPRQELPLGAEVTRVAPSPTGSPHIGTMLQAVVDRTLADQTGGVFILRIEDTDQKRKVEGAVDEILDALRWLELAPDEGPGVGGDYGPYVQSERLALYHAAAEWLVEHKYAYHCFCTPERLNLVRQQQVAAGQHPMYDRHCRSLTPGEVTQRLATGEKSVIRLLVPQDVKITYDDPLRGEVIFDSNIIDDQVLLKSGGFPTYHLAVIVDDHFMRITTAIRGEEWLPSVPKHILLYRYFGWPMPRIIHTALLRDVERRKLSKRRGETALSWFQMQGYLPDGMKNFATRIIWTHPENEDVYPFEDFAHHFSLNGLSLTGPVVDHDLLDFINGQYMRRLTPGDMYAAIVTWLDKLVATGQDVRFEVGSKAGRIIHEVEREKIALFASAFTRDPAYSRLVLTLEPERFKKFGDVILQYGFFYPEVFVPPTPEMISKPLGAVETAVEALKAYQALHNQDDSLEQWEGKIRQYAAEANLKAGKVFMTIRIALTGSSRTPPLYETIQIMGKDEVSRRLNLAIEACSQIGEKLHEK